MMPHTPRCYVGSNITNVTRDEQKLTPCTETNNKDRRAT